MNRFGRVGIAAVLLAGVLWAGGVAEAASSTTVTWKVSSLNKGEKKRLSTLVSTNSPGVKTWSKSGSCTLTPSRKPTTLTMGVRGSCTLTLKIAKSSRYPAKTSKKTITFATTVAPTTTTTVTPTTTTTVAPATTTTVASTCAIGGSCTVGVDTGPGGGIVFYYSATAFTSTGSDCGTNCHYLEAAPVDQSSDSVWTQWINVCYNIGSISDTNNCETNSIYSGNSTAQSASRTEATAIGMGMSNTNQIYARFTTVGSVATTDYAAGIAWAYTNNSKTDWFLPSKDELNELCKYAKNTGQSPGGGTVCAGGSEGSNRGFSNYYYWSSSEQDRNVAWIQHFSSNIQDFDYKNATDNDVRAVRAF